MRTELETVERVREWIERNGSLERVLLRDLDLTGLSGELSGVSAAGSVLMGCVLGARAAAAVVASGGMIFPHLDGVPYHPYRQRLYSPDELMEGYRRGDPGSFLRDTLDSRIYQHFTGLQHSDGPQPVLQVLAQRLHDHAMDRALRDWLRDGEEPRRVVGIMGGHAIQRDHPRYLDVARVARELSSRGYTVASGGGPGVMEAANLGAWMGRYSAADLRRAVDMLQGALEWSDPAWFDTAYAVRERFPRGSESLGVPTWFYGHEPSNLFATHVAKYFANSVREDGLLAIALHGVVYAPGSAGTVQEIFQDAAQNHYGTFRFVSPMVFLDTATWTRHQPAYPLLRDMAARRGYDHMLACLDDPDEVVGFIADHPPEPVQG